MARLKTHSWGAVPEFACCGRCFYSQAPSPPERAISRCRRRPRCDSRGCRVEFPFLHCLFLRVATVIVWVVTLSSRFSAVVGGFATLRDRVGSVLFTGRVSTGGWWAVGRDSPTLYLGREERAGQGRAGRRPRVGGRCSCIVVAVSAGRLAPATAEAFDLRLSFPPMFRFLIKRAQRSATPIRKPPPLMKSGLCWSRMGSEHIFLSCMARRCKTYLASRDEKSYRLVRARVFLV